MNLGSDSTSGDGLSLPDDQRTRWLLRHQSWLSILARCEIDRRFGGKIDASDLVQQTLLAAWQGWERMDAVDEPQRQEWLRKVLAHQMAHLVRHHVGTKKRSIDREVSIDQSLAHSSKRFDATLAATGASPSQAAIASEQRALVGKALESLPEDYRRVIILRNIEELAHAEVARVMNRSEAAVRMLWIRALAALSKKLGN